MISKEVMEVYTPPIADDLVQKLYRIKEATRIPMTRLLDGIVRDALDGVDVEVFGQDETAAYRLQVREGKQASWLHKK